MAGSNRMLARSDMTTMEAFDARDFGLAVKRLRNARGWTQADLAEWLGVNRVTVVRMEQGGPVSLRAAMRAIVLLGAKALIVPKGAFAEVMEPSRG
jgi:DNA-binding XRE family transcriptional regulator